MVQWLGPQVVTKEIINAKFKKKALVPLSYFQQYKKEGNVMMSKPSQQQIKKQALNLFTDLRSSLQRHNAPERYQYVLNILNTGIDKVTHKQQTPEREARAVYANVASQALADQLHFDAEENKILAAINQLAHSQGGWGEFNMLSTSNMWPSN